MNFGPGDGHVPPARVGRDHALDVGMHRPRREDDRVGHRQTGTSTGPLVTPQLRGMLGGRAILTAMYGGARRPERLAI